MLTLFIQLFRNRYMFLNQLLLFKLELFNLLTIHCTVTRKFSNHFVLQSNLLFEFFNFLSYVSTRNNILTHFIKMHLNFSKNLIANFIHFRRFPLIDQIFQLLFFHILRALWQSIRINPYWRGCFLFRFWIVIW